jgi:hypothetical protein
MQSFLYLKIGCEVTKFWEKGVRHQAVRFALGQKSWASCFPCILNSPLFCFLMRKKKNGKNKKVEKT